MKKLLQFGLCLAAFPPAMAQSNVQIYGIVDQFMEYAKTDDATVTRMTDGGVSASRLGFRGTEDLGGGSFASFNLEAGLGADTGAGTLPGPGLAFTRTSTVGLGGRWGRVDAGRMFTPLFNSLVRADAFAINAIYSPLNLISTTDAQTGIVNYASRASNMVYYRTPNSFPIVAHVSQAFGEAGSTGNDSGDLFSASLGYSSELFYISYAFQKTHGGTAAAPQPNPRISTYQAISAYFDATPQIRLFGNLIQSDSGDAAIADSRVVNIGALWTSGTSEFRAGATRRRVDGSSRSQFVWVLGYDYNFSKRTGFYGRVLHLQNRGGSTAAVGGLPIGASGGNGTSLGIGVRHSF